MTTVSPPASTAAGDSPYVYPHPLWLADVDAGIRFAVRVLDAAGIETYESCQGGEGHCAVLPFVRFHGGISEGYKAYTAVATFGLPVMHLSRFWTTQDLELTGPKWELIFWRPMEERADEQLMFITETRPNPDYEFPALR